MGRGTAFAVLLFCICEKESDLQRSPLCKGSCRACPTEGVSYLRLPPRGSWTRSGLREFVLQTFPCPKKSRQSRGGWQQSFRGRSHPSFLFILRYGFAVSAFFQKAKRRKFSPPLFGLDVSQREQEAYLGQGIFLRRGNGVTGADVSPTAQGDDPLENPHFAGAW